MKLVLALAFILLSGTALADYSQAVARREYCTTIGKIAEQAYNWRTDKYLKRSKQDYLNVWADDLRPGVRNADVTQYAIDYAYDRATDEKNAYMMTWAYCMDNAH